MRSQTELAELLSNDGIQVTQATLSRDLEELRAVKVRGEYLIPEDGERALRPAEEAPTRLIRGDLPWEGRLVEAPTLLKRDGRYHLFYSANEYGGTAYAIGWAVAFSTTACSPA